MINEQQERNLANANSRVRRRQDKANPMVIHIDNGRLMPNTERMRAHPKYRVYGGTLDASLPERMRWLAGALKQMPTKVVNSKEVEDSFDVGTASKDDLILFAMEQWGKTLDATTDIRVMRQEVMRLANNLPATEPAEVEDLA